MSILLSPLRLSENSLNSLTNHHPVSIILFKVNGYSKGVEEEEYACVHPDRESCPQEAAGNRTDHDGAGRRLAVLAAGRHLRNEMRKVALEPDG